MSTGASGDFGYLGDFYGFGEVFEAGTDLELGGAVDVVEVSEAVVLVERNMFVRVSVRGGERRQEKRG